MKLIIHRSGMEYYAYCETEKHFRRVEVARQKQGERKSVKILEDECNLHMVLDDGDYIVVDM